MEPTTTRGISNTVGDWHLSYGSALINAGDTTTSGLTPLDLDGLRRRRGRVDIGCYEYVPNGIAGAEQVLTFSIYPNPSNNIVTVEGASGAVTIYDITGRKVMYADIQKTSPHIDVSTLTSGMYIIECGNARQKIFVRH